MSRGRIVGFNLFFSLSFPCSFISYKTKVKVCSGSSSYLNFLDVKWLDRFWSKHENFEFHKIQMINSVHPNVALVFCQIIYAQYLVLFNKFVFGNFKFFEIRIPLNFVLFCFFSNIYHSFYFMQINIYQIYKIEI